jgi:hypothetical protein
VCLLIMLSRVERGAPLVVGANRDERFDRPAKAMTVLAEGPPRILGGLDERAGGTWLAVNEHGLVAGLTNRPLEGGRDDSKRSRGELPLWLAGHRTAPDAVAAFVKGVDPSHYNPCWILVGDRENLYTIEVMSGQAPAAEELPPGAYVLDNSALHTPGPKSDRVRAQVAELVPLRGDALMQGLAAILGDHRIPDGVPIPPAPPPGDTATDTARDPMSDPPPAPPVRPPQLYANCVHTEDYGTRSSLLCRVPSSVDDPVRVLVADGRPCTTPFADATGLWRP